MKPKILFICLGNICRSPLAEEVLRTKAAKAGIDVEVDSAGMIDYHEGELPDRRMRDHAFRHGYVLRHHSRPFRRSDFESFDLIVPMDHNNERSLLRLAATAGDAGKIACAASFFTRHDADTVPDPYYGGPEAFELAIELVEDLCDGLLAHLQAPEG